MKVIEGIRIVRLDDLNITWERYQEQEIGKKQKGVEREKRTAWVRLGGYYPTIELALNSIMDYLKTNDLLDEAETVEDYIKTIKELKINVEIKTREELKNED